MKFLITAFLSCLLCTNVSAQNVGINTSIPVENLQVDSSIKVGKNLALFGAKKNLVKFGDDAFVTIGEEVGDDKMYLRYGTLSLMRSSNSVGNGYMGINTDAPTTTLDINGGLRIRGNGAGVGKTLTSDANGVASWTGPIAFSAIRTGSNQLVNGFQSAPTVFTAMEYETNPGSFSFGPAKFKAPVTGIYHFSGSIAVATQANGNYWRILLSRTGGFNKQFDFNADATTGLSLHFSVDVKMNATDEVVFIFFNGCPNPVNIIYGDEFTFFSGHLIK
ncbi:MAG: hypothetical protein H7Y86_22310 [Rhizobacter sp.]|nr:hypothetical protein [Ferruginibacter sp.]